MKLDKNSLKDLKEFFSTEGKPVTTQEIQDWYRSLSEEEKDYYKNAELS